MVRPRSYGRRCAFESLEDRQMLAGDVTAKISGGKLVIKGDSLANGITIAAGSTAGTVVVTGVTAGGSATTVNSGTTAVTLSGFTGGLKIDMKGGDDSVTITGLTVTDDAKLEGGRGNDTFDITGSTLHGALTTILGEGDDTLTFDSTTVSGKAKFKGRSGDDNATLTDSTFSKLSVSLGRGDDKLTMSGTTASVDTSLNGRHGTNTFSNSTDDSLASLTVKHFNETTSTGSTTPTDSDVSLNTVSPISENGKAALTGSFTDSDLTDAHAVTIDWKDPNNHVNSTFAVPATSSLTAGQTITSTTDTAVLTISSISENQVNFSVQHQYLNDGPAPGNITNSDDSTITVTVTGGGGFNESGTTTVTVNDAIPTVALGAVTGITENSSATVTGSFTDIGLLDSHSMVVNWGDSNNIATSTFSISPIQNAAGTAILTNGQTITSSSDSAVLTITSIDTTTGKVGFSVQHLYLDDGDNGTASDAISISVSVTDLDGQSGANTASVTVSDAAPSVALDPIPSVAVNGTATLTGTYTDVGLLDQHSLLVDFGDGSVPQFLVPPVRNAAGAPMLTVGQTINSTNSTVSAVLTVTSFNSTTGQVGFSVQHQYTAAGSNIPVGVTALDDDTLSGSGSTSVTVGTS